MGVEETITTGTDEGIVPEPSFAFTQPTETTTIDYLAELNSEENLPRNFRSRFIDTPQGQKPCVLSYDQNKDITAYLGTERHGSLTGEEKVRLSSMLSTLGWNSNILAYWNNDNSKFEPIDRMKTPKGITKADKLFYYLENENYVILAVAGPNVKQNGYNVLGYIMNLHSSGIRKDR